MKVLIKYSLTILFSFSVVFFSCKDNPVKTDDDYDKAILGKITDGNGNPLLLVSVHYIFSLGTEAIFKNAVIQYSLQSTQNITLRIFNMLDEEIARPFDNQSQPAGSHSYFFDGNGLTNGIYSYELTGDDINQKGSFIILDDDISNLIQTFPVQMSGTDGSFRLDYSLLGLGRKFNLLIGNEEKELTISDSIKIVIYKATYQTVVETVKIDTTKTTYLDMVLPN